MSLIPVVPAYEGDFAVTISGNNVVLSDALTAAGWPGDTNVRALVSGNIGSTSSDVAAIICDVETDLEITLIIPSGSTVSGKGGNGLNLVGGNGTTRGGDAIAVSQPIRIENEGTIQGGGGGGAFRALEPGGNGGGGAGLVVGTGGTGASNGTLTAGGAASITGAGAGGDPGQPGESSPPEFGGIGGGAAGKSITGYSLVTYSGAGTLTGATG